MPPWWPWCDLSYAAQPRDGGLRVVAAARTRIPQAARRRASPGRRRAGSSAGEQRQPVRHAREHALRHDVRCPAGPGRSPIRPRGTSRPGSAPARGSRRVRPVAQLADGISQFGISPRIQVMQPQARAAARLHGSSVARASSGTERSICHAGESVPKTHVRCLAGPAVPPVAQPAKGRGIDCDRAR